MTSLLRVSTCALLALLGCGDETIPLGTGGNGSGAGTTTGFEGTGGSCKNDDTTDSDGDGFSPKDGDCNDCDPNTGPNAMEVPGSKVDEDCDGTVDEEEPLCDDGLVHEDADPRHAAAALDVCKLAADAKDWGLVSAAWKQTNGSEPPASPTENQRFHVGHGLVEHFGANLTPRRGAAMLALSTGEARDWLDPESGFAHGYDTVAFQKFYSCDPPSGFPKPVPGCGDQSNTGVPGDSVALELALRAPANAEGLSFQLDYMTALWPVVCIQVNPFFAFVSPPPAGHPDGNVAFDSVGNFVGSPDGLLACGCDGNPPAACKGADFESVRMFDCPLGDSDLIGTGYGRDGGNAGASTGWLRNYVPVEPNAELTLRLTISQNDQYNKDALVLLDRFQWEVEPGVLGTTPVAQ